MSTLLDQLSSHLDESQVQAIAQQLGISPEQAQQAISAALPTLLGAVGRKAETEEGAAQMHAVIQQHDDSMFQSQGSSMLGGLMGMLTGGNGGNSLGASILGHLLGSKQSKVQDAIGKSSGLDASKVAPLLAMLAPLVIGAIAKHQKSTGMSSSDLSGMLRHEGKSIEKSSGGSLIGRMFDQDGDGDFDLGDVVKLGMAKLFGKK